MFWFVCFDNTDVEKVAAVLFVVIALIVGVTIAQSAARMGRFREERMDGYRLVLLCW